jgi:hypothetical protein
MTGETKSGAQRACCLRPRCIGAVGPRTANRSLIPIFVHAVRSKNSTFFLIEFLSYSRCLCTDLLVRPVFSVLISSVTFHSPILYSVSRLLSVHFEALIFYAVWFGEVRHILCGCSWADPAPRSNKARIGFTLNSDSRGKKLVLWLP